MILLITLMLVTITPLTSQAYTLKQCTKYFKKAFGDDAKRFCDCKRKLDKGVEGDINKKLEIVVKCIARSNDGKN